MQNINRLNLIILNCFIILLILILFYQSPQHYGLTNVAIPLEDKYKDVDIIYDDTTKVSLGNSLNKTDFLSYQNNEQKIKILYPKNWTFSEENGSIIKFGKVLEQQKYLQIDDGSFVAFYSPLKNANDTYLDNLRIFTKDLSLQDYYFSKSDSSKSLYSDTLLKSYTSFYLDIIKNSNVTIIDPLSKTILGIDKYPAFKLGYSSQNGQQYILEAWTIYYNKIYGLKYTAQLNDYPKYLPLVKIMMDSFEIGNGTHDYKNLNNNNNSNSNNNNNKNYFSYQILNNISDKNDLAKPKLESLKQYAFSKINKDRQQFGLQPVNFSNNIAAQYQAQNVLSKMYMSHLTTDGQKPYIIYSNFGGTGKLRQNVAVIGDSYYFNKCINVEIICKKIDPYRTISLLEDIMVYNDAHAEWHHRYNILDKYSTNVSLGIAYNDYFFVIVQNFENNYISFFNPIVMDNLTKHIEIVGKLLNNTKFHNIEVYHDILPSNAFYQKYKDPNVYQPGKLIGAVKEATKIGFAIAGDNNTLMENKQNNKSSPLLLLSNTTTINPIVEKYSKSDNIFDIEFDLSPFIKEYGKGVYTIMIILEDQKQNIFPGGERSIFYN
jgi:hypothetical protein